MLLHQNESMISLRVQGQNAYMQVLPWIDFLSIDVENARIFVLDGTDIALLRFTLLHDWTSTSRWWRLGTGAILFGCG